MLYIRYIIFKFVREKNILLFKIVHLTYYAIKRRKRMLTFQFDPLPKQLHSSTTGQSFFGKNTGNNEKCCTVSRTNITFQERYKKLCSIPGLTVPKILSSRSACHGGEPTVIV